MSDPEQWQVSGNAPQAYERYMVPTLFTPWAQDSWPAPPCTLGNMCWMSPVGPGSFRDSRRNGSAPRGTLWGLIAMRR